MDAKEKAKILVSKRRCTFDEGELDQLLPLEPTIFMTKRNSERRYAAPPKKSFFKKLFSFLR